MNDIIETISINGFAVEIIACDYAENPLEWGTATLVTAHRRYDFGGRKLHSDASSIDEAFEWHLAEHDLSTREIIAVPVFMYEHGGIALSTTPFSCRFDSGQIGFLYETRAQIRKDWGVRRISPQLEEKIFRLLADTVNTLSDWANGEVYAYRIPALDETCGDYYGYDHKASGLLDAAREAIDWHLKQQRYKHLSKLKTLIKHQVPLALRSGLLQL